VDNKLSNINSRREGYEEDKRRYDRAFKISVVAELESGKPIAQIDCLDKPWFFQSKSYNEEIFLAD
jgi:hypothetical protein